MSGMSSLGRRSRFVSAAQAITAGGALTLAHGLGVQPTEVGAFLACLTAELGFAIGDDVFWDLMRLESNNNASRGLVIVPDLTNLNVRFGSDVTSTFDGLRYDTGVFGRHVSASWNVVFWAI